MRFFLLLAVLPVLIFPGCQSSQDNTSTASPESAAVSSIPWNKPASWEGAGALGGFNQQGTGH